MFTQFTTILYPKQIFSPDFGKCHILIVEYYLISVEMIRKYVRKIQNWNNVSINAILLFDECLATMNWGLFASLIIPCGIPPSRNYYLTRFTRNVFMFSYVLAQTGLTRPSENKNPSAEPRE
jgi:hypothetical protein